MTQSDSRKWLNSLRCRWSARTLEKLEHHRIKYDRKLPNLGRYPWEILICWISRTIQWRIYLFIYFLGEWTSSDTIFIRKSVEDTIRLYFLERVWTSHCLFLDLSLSSSFSSFAHIFVNPFTTSVTSRISYTPPDQCLGGMNHSFLVFRQHDKRLSLIRIDIPSLWNQLPGTELISLWKETLCLQRRPSQYHI